MEGDDLSELEKEVAELREAVSNNSRTIIELSNKSTHVFCKKTDLELKIKYYNEQNKKLKRFNEDQKIILKKNKDDIPIKREKRFASFNTSLKNQCDNNTELDLLENKLEMLKLDIKKIKSQIIEKEKRFKIIEENKEMEQKINELKKHSSELLSKQEALLYEQKDLKIQIESLQKQLKYPLKNISSSYETLLQLVTSETKKNVAAEFALRTTLLDSIAEIEKATNI